MFAKLEENLDSIFFFITTINLSTFSLWRQIPRLQKGEQFLCCNKVRSVSEYSKFYPTRVTTRKTAGNKLDLQGQERTSDCRMVVSVLD